MAKKKKQDKYLTININDMVDDGELYEQTIEQLKVTILSNFRVEKDKECTMLITSSEDEDCLVEYTFTQGNLLTILMLIRPFVVYEVYPTDAFFTDIDFSLTNGMNKYLDRVVRFFMDNYEIRVGEEISDVISELVNFMSKILGRSGITINLYDIAHMIRENQELKDIISFTFDDVKDISFKKVNDILKEKSDRFVFILKEDKDNCFSVILRSNGGINEKQLKESWIALGYKPDDRDYIIPVIINNNYVTGLTPLEYLIDACGGRKAQLINFAKTKESGYFSYKTTKAVTDISLDLDCIDCGTKHTIETYIDNQRVLDMLLYKNYYLSKDDETLYTIRPEEDNSHLIGQTIYLRSPIKCANNKGVCKTCYGELWRYNKERNIGIIAMLILNNQNTQYSLSAKHHLESNISEIKWNKPFEEYFTIDKEQIHLNSAYKKGFKFIIEDSSESDDDRNNAFRFQNITIFDTNANNRYNITLPKVLTLSDEIVKSLDEYYSVKEEAYVFDSKLFSSEDVLFSYRMENNALMTTLNNIVNLVDTNTYLKDNIIDNVYQMMINFINDSPLTINSVHLEILMRVLCVIEENDRGLFKFKDYNPIVELRRLTDSLLKSDSLATSLIFQEQYKQLAYMMDTYDKNRPSRYDEFWTV